ncbi:hypothetical protein [Blastococcus sp. PRF04-17]|uniref:hypothetical protein n=1 Tax=Blastococcus sp. PRF04-17 TaxID=2933797 RepID=UPI001FF59D7F|nr:hypothetical protein [Blastococcus sp. PRF04-17]UOY02176.1 hypothetical protein MVA48_01955 [Blastococcus sp. PRF04-17]
MGIASLVVLAVVAAVGLLLTARGERRRPAWAAAFLAALLVLSGALAWMAEDVAGGVLEGGTAAAVLAAVLGGGPIATAVLRAADPASIGVAGGPQDPAILRGGAWIGVLERAAIAVAMLAGSAEALAVVVAIKGLGRFAELRAPAAAERFIVGTLASGLWAAGCVGVALLLRG